MQKVGLGPGGHKNIMMWHHFAIRLGLALTLGALIEAERQWRQRPDCGQTPWYRLGRVCSSCWRLLRPEPQTTAFASPDR